MDKKVLSKVSILLLTAFVFFIAYYSLTNKIQTEKLYPWNQDWFYYSVWQSYAPANCFRIEPNHLEFYGKEKLLHVNTGFMKACNFTHAYIWFTVSDLDSFQIENPRNLIMKRYGNLSEKHRIGYIINFSDMIDYEMYYVDFYYKLNDGFYNFYSISAEGAEIGQIRFSFDNSLNGYRCDDQECFSVIEGTIKKEQPLWRGANKEYHFYGSGSYLIRFNPKSAWWDFLLKLLDTFILGTVAILLYEIFNLAFIQGFISKKK